MRATLLVSIKCPECGGSVSHAEGAYTFTCPFCASALRCQTKGVTLKYAIPARLEHAGLVKACAASLPGAASEKIVRGSIRTFYKPFWYVRGMVYSCRSNGLKNGVEARAWFHTFEANSSVAPALRSLGLRSETLEVIGFESERLGKDDTVLPVTVSKDKAKKIAEAASDRVAAKQQWRYRKSTVVGERFVLIYYPVMEILYRRTEGAVVAAFFDGVSGALLGSGLEPATVERNKNTKRYGLKILTHRCKNCGHDLPSHDFDLLFKCSNCTRLWLLEGDDYLAQKVRLLKSTGETVDVYVPFWRFEITASSKNGRLELKSIKDLAGFMKMGRHLLRGEEPGKALMLYVPAIVAKNARAVIKLAARIGTFQKKLSIDPVGVLESDSMLNASMPPEEAKEMLRPLLFLITGRIDRKALEFYSDFEITVTGKELVWYPFEVKGDYLYDRYHNYSLPKRSLDLRFF